MYQMIRWSVFHGEGGFAVVPQTPLLIRLRQMTSDVFFEQDLLKPLKRLIDTNFIIGVGCILAAAYVTLGSVALFAIGIASLSFSALYWFATHWLCVKYLRYRGLSEGEVVEALDLEAARKAVQV